MAEDLLALYSKFKEAMSVKNENPNDKILIIDGTNFFIRNWSVNDSRNENGEPIGGAIGFVKSLGYLASNIRPSKIIVVFDGKGGSKRRKDINSNYKSGRGFKERTINGGEIELTNPQDVKQNMLWQFSQLVSFLNHLPVKILSLDYIEADDVIAYIARKVFDESKIVIASSDKDYLQLIDENICVYSPITKQTMCSEEFYNLYKFNSKNFIWYKCLLGDSSDSVKGIKGVGNKTVELIHEYLNSSVYTTPEVFYSGAIVYLDNKIATLDVKIKEQKVLYNKYVKFKTLLANSEELILTNFKLMQLSDVNISGNNKMIIMKNAQEPIKHNYTNFKLVMGKYNYALNILNIDTWCRNSFSSLVLTEK